MNRLFHIPTAGNVFAGLLVMTALVLVILAPKAAVNVDEQLHYPHAKNVVNWYFTFGQDKSSLHTPETNLKYYGQSVDNFTAFFNRIFQVEDEFLIRHITGAAMFLLLLLFSGLIARELTGSYYAAIIAVLAILFMPRVFGHAFGDLKDVPFATGYAAGLLMIIRYLKEMPDPGWRTAILLGLSVAFTVSVRAGGFILFAYLGLFMIIYWSWKPFALKQIVSTKPVFVRLLGQAAVILLIGYFAGLLFWPFALQNVFVHPIESLRVMEHYKVSIRQIFEGDLTWSTRLPWYYLPKWLAISTPVFIFTGILVFAGFYIQDIVRRIQLSKLFYQSIILFAFLFPLVYVVVINANLYSGVRQMLFILPPLAILSAVGIYRLLQSNYSGIIRYSIPVVFFVLMLAPLKHQASTFPADYVYFNVFSGGNKGAWSNYEYDYYFHGLKEPVNYLKQFTSEDNKKVIVAMNSNLSNYFEDSSQFDYNYVRYLERSSEDWDYGLFGINYIHPWLLKNDKWQSAEIIKTFRHKGNPVAVLLQRLDKTDLAGIQALEAHDYEEAEKLLKKAVKSDPNNVWLFVHLAKISLFQDDDQSFNRYIEQGRKIYPEYEPFYLLEAKRFYDRSELEKSMDKLEQLFEINPRYTAALPLYKALKEKINSNS